MQTNGQTNGHHIWKHSTIFLAGVVLTLTGVWVTHVREVLTRDAVIDLIRSNSPYSEDRQLILRSLESNSQKIDEQTKEIQKLREQIVRLEAQARGRR